MLRAADPLRHYIEISLQVLETADEIDQDRSVAPWTTNHSILRLKMDVGLAIRYRVNDLHDLGGRHARVEIDIVVGRESHTRSVRAELLTGARNETVPRIAKKRELEI